MATQKQHDWLKAYFRIVGGAKSVEGRVAGTASSLAQKATDMASTAAQRVERADPTGLVGYEVGGAKGVYKVAKGLGDMADNSPITPLGLARTAAKVYKFDTDEEYRDESIAGAVDTAKKAATAARVAAGFVATAVTDPGKAADQVSIAAASAVNRIEADYRQAAADGRGSEFIGTGVGEAGAVAVTAALAPEALGAEAEALGGVEVAGAVEGGLDMAAASSEAGVSNVAGAGAGEASGSAEGMAADTQVDGEPLTSGDSGEAVEEVSPDDTQIDGEPLTSGDSGEAVEGDPQLVKADALPDDTPIGDARLSSPVTT
jgi:hypothetical protein